MSVITYEDVTPEITHTTMQKMFVDGVHRTYMIIPDKGYLLHDKSSDAYLENVDIYNEETGMIEIVTKTILGFVSGSTSCSANYNFITNPRELYTILKEDVPLDSQVI